jgi:predicted SprT family Zn-dependent metalloprotease
VPVPLTFELELEKPKCAGLATTVWELGPVKKIIGQKVALNMTVFRDNVSVFLNTVVPHELAHLDQHWQDFQTQSASQSHGYVWQGSMRAMAQVPKATINLDFSKAEKVFREHKAAQKRKAAELKKKLQVKEA